MSTPIPTQSPEPTQVVHPWKAAVRTGIQTFLGAAVVLAVVAPQITEFLDQWFPGSPVITWITVGAAFIASLAALISRIMALPQVNAALTSIGLGATPKG